MNAKAAIIKELQVIVGTGFRPSDIFRDWIDLTYQSLRTLPHLIENLAEHGQSTQNDPEADEVYARLQQQYHSQWETAYRQFANAFAILLSSSEDHGKSTYADTVGDIFMDWGNPYPGNGQFFTPMIIAKMMAKIIAGNAEKEIYSRLREALKETREYQLGELLGITPRDEILFDIARCQEGPIAYAPLTVNDPACGSGIMLLAVASELPDWMVRYGLIQFYGTDIDRLCVRMCQINVMLYGLNGSGVWLTTGNAVPAFADIRTPEPSAVIVETRIPAPPGEQLSIF